MDIRHINPLTGKDYFVSGSTALLDVIGKTINGTIGRVKTSIYRSEGSIKEGWDESLKGETKH